MERPKQSFGEYRYVRGDTWKRNQRRGVKQSVLRGQKQGKNNQTEAESEDFILDVMVRVIKCFRKKQLNSPHSHSY